ncbi:O-antigen ligase family protein [Alteromonas arenosi]
MSFLVAYNINWSTNNYIFFIQWIVVFYLATGIVNTKERLYVFFLVMFMCSLKVAFGTARVWAFRGFSFTTWGLMGPPGYFQNSGELAILMLILFPLGYMLYRDNKDNVRVWEKYVLMAAWVCPLLTILGSSSRGAQLALAVQLVVLFYKQIFKPKVLIGATLLVSIGWHVLPDEQKARFTDIGEDKSSLQRKLYWKHGWNIMKEYPVLGIGYFNFIPYYRDHYPQDMLYGKAELPHNIFLQIGTDAGFIGLFFYLILIIFALTKRLPNFPLHPDPGDKILLAMWRGLRLGIIGFVMAGQFVTVGYYPFLWISLALQASLLLVYQNKQQGIAHGEQQGLPARSSGNS